MKKLLIMMLEKILITLIAISVSFPGDPAFATDTGEGLSEASHRKFQKGMCYAAWGKYVYSSPYSDKSIERLAQTGTDWISIVSTWYQRDAQSPYIYPTEKTPADYSIKHAIRRAHELGLKVMLKPHIDLINQEDGQWRGDIFFYKENDWKVWFRDYKKFITRYARIAEEAGVDILCIGTELSATIDRKDEWIEIIQAVRNIYKGRLTYAANWDDEFYRVQFWGELDFAGIDAYFPLSNNENPAFTDLKAGWDRWLEEIGYWAKSLGRPIIFTEVGYSSTSCAAMAPWSWDNADRKVDLKVQANCYKALLESAWGREWLAGIYWWNWDTAPDAGGPNHNGFTPQNKPAQTVLAEWYKRKI